MIKQFLLFFLFTSLSFSQVDEIVNIFNIPLGLSIKMVKEKWDCNNFNEYANLIHQTDDLLKFEGKKDSFFLGASFHFVDDSLFMFVVVTKQTFDQIKQLSVLVNENFGESDSVSYQKMGKEGKSSFQIYQASYWSKLNLINNSVDNISTSQETIERKLNVFSFSKSNALLMNKAKLLNQLQLKL
jgi:hypothetical protein